MQEFPQGTPVQEQYKLWWTSRNCTITRSDSLLPRNWYIRLQLLQKWFSYSSICWFHFQLLYYVGSCALVQSDISLKVCSGHIEHVNTAVLFVSCKAHFSCTGFFAIFTKTMHRKDMIFWNNVYVLISFYTDCRVTSEHTAYMWQISNNRV